MCVDSDNDRNDKSCACLCCLSSFATFTLALNSLSYYSDEFLLHCSGGGGGSVGEARDIHREKSSNSSHQHQSTTTTTTTSRMHFDRMENLMSVISGAKTFTLYPPTESTRLYAGGPCISASLSATLTRNQSGRSRGSITNIHFSR